MAKTARRQRGEGSLYQRASDGMWVAAVDIGYGADGKRRRKVVTSKAYATAQGKLRDLRRQLDEHGDLPTASMTTEAWLTYWVEHIAATRSAGTSTRRSAGTASNGWHRSTCAR